MAFATATTIRCSVCGGEIAPEIRASYCPSCGAPLTPRAAEVDVLGRSVDRWWAVLVAIAAAAATVVGVMAWRVAAAMDGDTSPAAEAMDDLAPIAEGWVDQREQIAEAVDDGDPGDVRLAVDGAVAWTELNAGVVADIALDVDGKSEPLYAQLTVIFRERLDVLRRLQASAGVTTSAGWAAADARLDQLGAESDAVICSTAEVIADEGGEADDHITPAMDVDC